MSLYEITNSANTNANVDLYVNDITCNSINFRNGDSLTYEKGSFTFNMSGTVVQGVNTLPVKWQKIGNFVQLDIPAHRYNFNGGASSVISSTNKFSASLCPNFAPDPLPVGDYAFNYLKGCTVSSIDGSGADESFSTYVLDSSGNLYLYKKYYDKFLTSSSPMQAYGGSISYEKT